MPSQDKRPSFAVPSLPPIDENPSDAALQSEFDTRTSSLSVCTEVLQQLVDLLTVDDFKTQSAGYFSDLASYLNPLKAFEKAVDACLAVLTRSTSLGLSDTDWQPVETATQSGSIADFSKELLLRGQEELNKAVANLTEIRIDNETAGDDVQDTKAVILDLRSAYRSLASPYITRVDYKVRMAKISKRSAA